MLCRFFEPTITDTRLKVFNASLAYLRILAFGMALVRNLDLHKFSKATRYFSNPSSLAFSRILESIPERGNHGIRLFFKTIFALYSAKLEEKTIGDIANAILLIFVLEATDNKICVTTVIFINRSEISDILQN